MKAILLSLTILGALALTGCNVIMYPVSAAILAHDEAENATRANSPAGKIQRQQEAQQQAADEATAQMKDVKLVHPYHLRKHLTRPYGVGGVLVAQNGTICNFDTNLIQYLFEIGRDKDVYSCFETMYVPSVHVAVLRNGFTIRHEHRLMMGTTTRLYLAADDSNFTDVPTSEIVEMK